MRNTGLMAVLLIAALPLVACGPFPDARNRAHERAVMRQTQRHAVPTPEGTRAADAAESACLNAAAAAGFNVRGLDGSTDVAGPDGRPVARRIMVRVNRFGGPVITWPCTYHLASGQVGA